MADAFETSDDAPGKEDQSNERRDVDVGLRFNDRSDAYRPFVIMEELLEKLKLVNYENGFCTERYYKPVSR